MGYTHLRKLTDFLKRLIIDWNAIECFFLLIDIRNAHIPFLLVNTKSITNLDHVVVIKMMRVLMCTNWQLLSLNIQF